jgi:hypothetical protein
VRPQDTTALQHAAACFIARPNSEHAIKAFVRLRNVIGANGTPKGIREYLVGREERPRRRFTAGFGALGSIRFRKVGWVPAAKACDL